MSTVARWASTVVVAVAVVAVVAVVACNDGSDGATEAGASSGSATDPGSGSVATLADSSGSGEAPGDPPTTWPEQIAFTTRIDLVQRFGVLDVASLEATILSPPDTECAFGDWSTDGRYMAYVCDGSVYVAWGDASHAELVFEGQGAYAIEWSPVADEIAFYGTRPEPFDWEIWTAPTTGGNAQELTNGVEDLERMRWSPQGDRLVVRTEGAEIFSYVLSVVRLDTGTGDVLRTDEGVFSEGLSVAYAGPARGFIAYTSNEGGGDYAQVWAVDFDNANAAQISDFALGTALWGEWSRDGTLIAWTQLEGSDATLVVAQADGSDPAVLPISSTGELAWSPDDTRLLHDTGSGNLRLIELSSGATTLVDLDMSLMAPRWRPAAAS